MTELKQTVEHLLKDKKMCSVAFGTFHERGNENFFELVLREVNTPEQVSFKTTILKACYISYHGVSRITCPSIILNWILKACLAETFSEFVELLSFSDPAPYMSIPATHLVMQCAALIVWERR
jgi:hypothetical protein